MTDYFPKTEVPKVNATPDEASAVAALAAGSIPVFADGTSTTPSFAFSANTGTGLHHSGTGATSKIGVAVNGADCGAWNTTGLAVGHASPSYKLHVEGTTYLHAAGAAAQAGAYIYGETSSGNAIYTSGVDATCTNSSAGTMGSGYGVRANVVNSGAGKITDAIGVKVNNCINSGAGSIDFAVGIFITGQTAGVANAAINILGTGDGSSIGWSSVSNTPEIRLSQASRNCLVLTTGTFGISGTPAAFMKFLVSGTVVSTSLALAHYTNVTLQASQDSAKLVAYYLSPTFDVNGRSGVTSYNIYSYGAGMIYFAGKVGCGVEVPTAKLNIAGGTATAETAPLKITSGTLLTTPEAGAIETDGTHVYWTTDAGSRKQLDN